MKYNCFIIINIQAILVQVKLRWNKHEFFHKSLTMGALVFFYQLQPKRTLGLHSFVQCPSVFLSYNLNRHGHFPYFVLNLLNYWFFTNKNKNDNQCLAFKPCNLAVLLAKLQGIVMLTAGGHQQFGFRTITRKVSLWSIQNFWILLHTIWVRSLLILKKFHQNLRSRSQKNYWNFHKNVVFGL